MENFEIRFLSLEEIDGMIPFVELLNPGMETSLIKSRLEEMKQLSFYKCLGAFDGEKLIAICGMWEMTKFYSGKQIEIDNFMIYPEYRSQGLGKKIMQVVYDYAKKQGCLTCELNTYIAAAKAHKFYFNEGFYIKGFHMFKDL